jgi:hypothetical protein
LIDPVFFLEVLGQTDPGEAVIAGLGLYEGLALGMFIKRVGGFGLAAIRAQHVGIKPGAAQRIGFLFTTLTDLYVIRYRLGNWGIHE